MKFIRWTVAACALLLLGFGCSKGGTPSSYNTYTSSAHHWSVSYPNTWTVDESKISTTGLVYFFAPKDAKGGEHANVNVNYTANAQEATPDQMIAAVTGELVKAGGQNVKGAAVNLPAGPAIQFTYSISQGGATLHGEQYGLFKGTDFYVMTFTSDDTGNAQFTGAFEDMAKSFKP